MFDADIADGPARAVFTARAGGVSAGPWSSLNLQTDGEDDPANIEENFRRLRAELDADIAMMRQVHGSDVAWVDDAGDVPTADAIATTRRGLALMVRAADCVPVLVHARQSGAVAAIHAGRGGLLADVVPRAMESLRAHGRDDLHAWVGPRACGACYELPAEMADAVEHHVPGTRTITSRGSPGVDIGAGVLSQLADAGVHIHDIGAGRCTIEDELLFSYRRQGRRSGRFAGAVVLT